MTDVVRDPAPPTTSTTSTTSTTAAGRNADRTASASTPAPASAARVSYLPGLDGLRAVAVLAVFLFHGGVGAVAGGYLAVSTFFTLSGFLITLLLCAEQTARGRIAIGAFWERRVRRLLPAAALGIALAAAVTALVGTASQRQAIGGDGIATLVDVANWRFVVEGQSYGQLFATPSALQHAWSLAIEAQFYWLYPLLFVGVLRAVRGNRRHLGIVLAVLFLASIVLTRSAGFSADRIYYGTDTRAAELLAGAVLGVIVASRPGTLAAPGRRRTRRVIAVASVLAAALLVGAWIVTPQGAGWLGDGGLGLYALVSCVVILGASVPTTPVARVLAVGPLRRLGRISYGFYLFHWPVLLLLAPDRVPGPPVLRLVLAGGATLVLAALSSRYVERPIRTRSRPFTTVGLGPIVVGCAVVALVPSLAVAQAAPPPTVIADLAPGALLSGTDALGAPDGQSIVGAAPSAAADGPEPPSPPSTLASGALAPRAVVAPSRPLRVVVVGDSVAALLGPLLDDWGSGQRVWSVASYARVGCGIVRGGTVHNALGELPFGPECRAWVDEWPQMLRAVQPDLVILAGGFWDAVDRRVTPSGPWQRPGDPELDQLIRDEYDLALDLLTGTGIPVVWLDHPPIRADGPEAATITPLGYDDARMHRLDEIQDEVTASHPSVRVVRTLDFLAAWPGGILDETIRPDGMHVDGAGAAPFIAWLAPEVLDAYWSVQVPSDRATVTSTPR